MGLRIRRSIKIAPGIKLNIGKKGFNSVSIGKRGAHYTIGKHGTRTTVGIPGTGVSYTNYKKYDSNKKQDKNKLNTPEKIAKNVANLELKYKDIPFEVQKIPYPKIIIKEFIVIIIGFILAIAIHPVFAVFTFIPIIMLLFSGLFNKQLKAKNHQWYAIRNYQFSKFNDCINRCEKSLKYMEWEDTKKLMQEAQKRIDDCTEVKQITDEDIIKLR